MMYKDCLLSLKMIEGLRILFKDLGKCKFRCRWNDNGLSRSNVIEICVV